MGVQHSFVWISSNWSRVIVWAVDHDNQGDLTGIILLPILHLSSKFH